MAKLTTRRRKKLKSSIFGLPKERKYPMDTRGRAANAKARAQQQYDKGDLSKEELDKIDAKANRILYGTSKPKTNEKGAKNTRKRTKKSVQRKIPKRTILRVSVRKSQRRK